MLPYTRNMRQPALYWPPGQNDGFGGLIYERVTPILCRWQNKIQLIRDAEGKEITSSTVVYPDRELEPQGRIVLDYDEIWVLAPGFWDNQGVWLTDAQWGDIVQPPLTAREILIAGSSPSLRATQVLHKVWL